MPAVDAQDRDGGISMSNPQTLSSSIRDKEIDAVRDLGDRIRLPINWDELQPADETPVAKWKWDVFDKIIASAVPDDGRKKLSVLVILGSVPGWANGNGGYGKPATDPAKFEKYCFEVARRYIQKGVNTFQIGNEVNLVHPGWTPEGAAYYQGFLQPGGTGIWKASLNGELSYNVVMGSLAPNTWNEVSPHPVKFLKDVYQAAGGSEPGNSKWLWGSLSYHPYVGPAADPPSADVNLSTLPKEIYDVMVANGEGEKKLWATEFGTPTHGGKYVTDEKKLPAWVHDVVEKWYGYEFAGPLFWYTARDKKAYGKSDNREDFFGLLYSNFSKKDAYPVLKSYFNPEAESRK